MQRSQSFQQNWWVEARMLKMLERWYQKSKWLKFHAVKVRQFECVTHSSTEEEKIALVDKMVKFDELVHH